MRTFKSTLVLVALAAVAGCAHTASPVEPTVQAASRQHVAAAADPDQHAKDLVTQKFTEAGTQVESVEVTPAAGSPGVYTFICEYRRGEFGQMCEYEAKGQLDVITEKMTTHHRVRFCLGTER